LYFYTFALQELAVYSFYFDAIHNLGIVVLTDGHNQSIKVRYKLTIIFYVSFFTQFTHLN